MLQTHFPTVMYDMLEEAETNGHAHIISWWNGGRAFKIHKPDLMILLLNTYLNQTKYKSFLRQLQTYGFTRHTKGELEGIASHPLLIKGKRFLCLKMRRKIRQKKSTATTKSSSKQQPNRTRQKPKQVPQTMEVVSSNITPQMNVQSQMEPLRAYEPQNCESPLRQSGCNFEQDFSSNCITPEKSTVQKSLQDWTGFHMPLQTSADSVIAQEVSSDSMISNILDGIDDDLCDYFTKINNDALVDNNPLPSTFALDIEGDDDDDWLKGITYDGSDVVLDSENFDMAFHPVDPESNADGGTSVVSL